MLIYAIVILAPLMIGSVHLGPTMLLGALGLGACWGSFQKQPQIRPSLTGLLFGALAIVALLQVIPLPPALLALCSPHAAAAHLATRQVLDPGLSTLSAWAPLSLDPRATLEAGARWATLSAGLFAVANLPRDVKTQRGLVRALAISMATMVACGVLQKAIDPHKLLGFYQADVPSHVASTFVSWNHAASFLLFGALAIASASLLLRRVPVAERLGLGLIALAGMVLSQLYEGTGALGILGFGVLWFGGLAWVKFRTPPPTHHRLLSWLGIPVVVALVFSVAFWGLAPVFHSPIPSQNPSSLAFRSDLIATSLKASLTYPILGAGADTVPDTLSPLIDWETLPPQSYLTSVEHTFAEWLFTLGPIPGTLATLYFILLLGLPALGAQCEREPKLQLASTTGLGLLILMIAQLHFPLRALGLAIPMLFFWEASLQRALRGIDPKTSLGPRLGARVIALAQIRLPQSRRLPLFLTLLLLCLAPSLGALALPATAPPAQHLKHRPLDAQSLIKLAKTAHETKDFPLALRAHTRAFSLQNRPTHRLAMATTLASQGDLEAATLHYIHVLHHTPSSKALAHFLRDVPTGPLRHHALTQLSPRLWRQAIALMLRHEGPLPPAAFVEALVLAKSQDLEAYNTLLEFYDATRMDDVLESWLGIVERKTFSHPTLSSLSLFALYHARLLLRQNQAPQALDLLIRHAHRSAPLAHMLLRFPPPSPQDQARQTAWLEALERTQAVWCGPPALDSPAMATSCLWARATTAEAKLDFKAAEALWKQVDFKEPQTLPLAFYLLRRQKCLSLKALQARTPDPGYKARLTTLVSRCHDP